MLLENVVRAVRIAVYVMLVLSAGTAFFIRNRLWESVRLGELPSWAPMAPAILFTTFVLVYSVDRWILVRKRDYPMNRALLQVGFALIFVTLLWPGHSAPPPPQAKPALTHSDVSALLGHPEPRVRAATCELLAWRMNADGLPEILELAQSDDDASTRQACQAAASKLSH